MPESLFNKVSDLKKETSTLLKKRLWHRSFPVNFVKFLTTFLQNTGRLFLKLIKGLINLFKMFCWAVSQCFNFKEVVKIRGLVETSVALFFLLL